jgi:hypothetical protein
MNIIGLDFDNTLIDYDLLFYKTALEFKLIPKHTIRTKVAVRDYLLSIGKEDFFTELQGEVYGKKIISANKSSGVISALINLKNLGYTFKIISHKTKFPIAGEKYDLHESALNWLKVNKFMDKDGLNINLEDIFFEPTKDKKVEKIHSINCKYYIDDLKEILQMISNKVIKIHYNKNHICKNENESFYSFNNWGNLNSLKIF